MDAGGFHRCVELEWLFSQISRVTVEGGGDRSQKDWWGPVRQVTREQHASVEDNHWGSQCVEVHVDSWLGS